MKIKYTVSEINYDAKACEHVAEIVQHNPMRGHDHGDVVAVVKHPNLALCRDLAQTMAESLNKSTPLTAL